MNWFRILVRFGLAFVVLYLLGYVVPGFSGLTLPLLALIGATVALVSALIERQFNLGSKRQRALSLFLSTVVIIYFFSLIFIGRPPVASAVIAAILLSLVEFAFPKPIRREKGASPN